MRCLLKCSIVKEYRLCRRKLFNKRLVLNLWNQQFVRSLYWYRLLFTCLKRSIGRSYATQCFHLEYSEMRDTRATDIVKTTGVYIETHTTCTHAFLMPLMRVSLCNDLSCYPLESLRTEIHPRLPSTAWMRLPAAVDHITKKIFVSSFLITH